MIVTIVATLLLAVCSISGCSGSRGPAHNGTNVLLIVLDTVRADRFSCYGYDRPTTPNLDRVAQRGVRFQNFYANSSWTLSSHASLFTGLYPAAHQATQETLRLSEGPTTLAEILTAAGYETFGASSNGVVSIESGLARGFENFVEVFRQDFKKTIGNERGHFNNIAFRRFLESSERDRPFFAFLNYVAAHAPYTPPEPFRSRLLEPGLTDEQINEAESMRMSDHYMGGVVTERHFAILNQLYDGEINYLDTHVFDLLNILLRDGRLDNTLIIITSDHGENIGDHDHFAHVFNIYNTLLKIPLIFVFPGELHAGEVRTENAQLLDLFPTILKQCGIEYDLPPEGRDLFAQGAAQVERDVMAEYYYPRQVLSVFDKDEMKVALDIFTPFMRRLRSIQSTTTKLIWGSDGMHELYRVDQDPEESKNLLLENPDHPDLSELQDRLTYLVDTFHGEEPLDPTPPVGWMVPGFEDQVQDEELLKKLRSLGYVK